MDQPEPAKKQESPLGLPKNGRLCLYNQFPRCYDDIHEMTLHLFEISEMSFNSVWINPIQATGKLKHPLGEDPLRQGRNTKAYSGSLYAKKDSEKIDDDFSINKYDNKKNDEFNITALKNYTKIAKMLGLTPLFDLVLNQVALDAEVYETHLNWFIFPMWDLYIMNYDIDISKIDLNDKRNSIILIGRGEEKTAYFIKKIGQNKCSWYQTNEGNYLKTKITLSQDEKELLMPGEDGHVKRNHNNRDILMLLIVKITKQVELPPNRSKHFGPYCCDFDFGNKSVLPEIMKFIKKEIHTYIVEYGFLGVRVDAVKHLPPNVQSEIYNYIYDLCDGHYKVEPIIFAEVFLHDEDIREISEKLKELGITHVTNFLHWEKWTKDYRTPGNNGCSRWEKEWEKKYNTLAQLYWLRAITLYEKKIQGGTIGFPGCHDTQSLYDAALKANAESIVQSRNNFAPEISNYDLQVEEEIKNLQKSSPEKLEFLLKETIAGIALTSDAGWYLLSGDEFGYAGRKWVFDFYVPCDMGNSFVNHWKGELDLRPFVKGVNALLQSLPHDPDLIHWAQHVVLQDKPDLMIVIQYKGDNYGKTPNVIIVNLSEQKVELTLQDIQNISLAACRRESKQPQKEKVEACINKAKNEGKIFCLGNFELKELVINNNVKILNPAFHAPTLENSAHTVNSNIKDPVMKGFYSIKSFLLFNNREEAKKAFTEFCHQDINKDSISPTITCLYSLGRLFLKHNMSTEVFGCYTKITNLCKDNKIGTSLQMAQNYYKLGNKAFNLNNTDVAKQAFKESYNLLSAAKNPTKDAFKLLKEAFEKVNLEEYIFLCKQQISKINAAAQNPQNQTNNTSSTSNHTSLTYTTTKKRQ